MKKISVIVAIAIVVVVGVICITACRPAKVESLVLSETTIELKEGENKLITCTILPAKAAKSTITWSSTDNAIATVNEMGLITAVSKGTCVVNASCGGVNSSVIVNVKTKGPDFRSLYEGLSDKYGWELGSDGSYLKADTNYYDLDDYSNSDILYAIRYMNIKMGLPDSLYNDMINTAWSMGKQTETFENLGISVSWTYHPDKGLEVTYKLINK